MGAHKDPDFQRRATATGKAWQVQCEIHLNSLGFRLLGPKVIERAGIAVDQVAVNKKGRTIYFEFKGGYEGGRPGLVRTDTTKKVLCNAFLMRECDLSPFVVIASVKPEEGSSSAKMIELAADVLFDLISLHDMGDRKRLEKLVDIDDFSKPRLPRVVAKVEASKIGKPVPPPVSSDASIQIAFYPDLKVRESGKRKRRKISPKEAWEPVGEQLKLFDEL